MQIPDIALLEKFLDEETQGSFSIHDLHFFTAETAKLKSGERYLEIGVDNGKSFGAAYLTTDPGVEVWGVDLVNTKKRQRFFAKLSLPDDHFICADSVATGLTWTRGPIKLLLIDGGHDYADCLADICAWYPHLAPGATILFHDYDISNSPGVVQAVDRFAGGLGLTQEVLYSDEFHTSLAKVSL